MNMNDKSNDKIDLEQMINSMVLNDENNNELSDETNSEFSSIDDQPNQRLMNILFKLIKEFESKSEFDLAIECTQKILKMLESMRDSPRIVITDCNLDDEMKDAQNVKSLGNNDCSKEEIVDKEIEFLKNELAKAQQDLQEYKKKEDEIQTIVKEMKNLCPQTADDTLKDESKDKSNDSSNDPGLNLRILRNYIIDYLSKGQYSIAETLCKSALEFEKTNNGNDHPNVASISSILALVYRQNEKYDEAIKLNLEALAIREKIFGSNHLGVAAILNNLSILYAKINRFKEAESFCSRSLEIRKSILNQNHPDIVKEIKNLEMIRSKIDKEEQNSST